MGAKVGVAAGVEVGSRVTVGAVGTACIGVGEGAGDWVKGVAAPRESVVDSSTDVIGGSECGTGEASTAVITFGVAPSMKSISVLKEYDAGRGVGVL